MRIHASILIKRRISAVFRYLSTPCCLTSWVAGVTIANGCTPELRGIGDRFVVRREACLGPRRSTWEVTTYQPPRALAVRGLDETAGAEVRWTLEALQRGATQVWVEADLAVASFFELAPSQLERSSTHQLELDLDALRRRLETDALSLETVPLSGSLPW